MDYILASGRLTAERETPIIRQIPLDVALPNFPATYLPLDAAAVMNESP